MSSSKRPLLIIFLTIFIDLLGFGIVLPLLPRYALQLKADRMTLGLLMASFSAMQFLFSPIWGRISDRVGRRPILMMGLAGSTLFYALFGVASTIGSLTLMFVARIGAGIFGATISTAQAYIADSTSQEKRTAGMAIIGAAFGIGFVFGPLLGALALPADAPAALHATDQTAPATAGQQAAAAQPDEPLSAMPGYVASGLSCMALLLAIFILPESLKPGAQAASSHWFDREGLRIAMSVPSIPSLIAVFFLATFGFGMFESTLSLITKFIFEMPDRSNFYMFSYIGLVLTLAQGLVVRRMSKLFSDKTLAVSGVILEMLGMAGLCWAIGYDGSQPISAPFSRDDAAMGKFGAEFHGSQTAFMVVMPLLITGFALLQTSVQSMISQRSRPDQQGGILGVNQAGSALARIVAPLYGFAVLYQGLTLPYLSGVALCGIVLILMLRLSPGSETAATAEPTI